MIAKVDELRSEIAGLCSTAATSPPTSPPTLPPYSPYKWISVTKTQFGHSNLRHSGTLSYNIPNVIPSGAREVLIHVAVFTGISNPERLQDLKIFTQIETTRYEKYLYIVTYNTNAYNINSDNMWFPMPPNRRCYIYVPAAHIGYNGVTLYAIGYR